MTAPAAAAPQLADALDTVAYTARPLPVVTDPADPRYVDQQRALNHGILLLYQARWVADESLVKVAEKSRRVGLTWAEASDDVLIAASASGQDVFYIGFNKEMALEYIETCAQWARAINAAAAVLEEGILQDEDKQIQVYRIRFDSGHKIMALSSRPSNLRGKQGVVVLDEAAFHDDIGEVLKAAFALLMWGGKVRIISTHNGVLNAFNELIVDIRAGRAPYSLHRITLDDAIAEGLYRRICEKRRIEWTPEGEQAWRAEIRQIYRSNAGEELDVVPASGAGTYIPGALIEKRMSDAPQIVRLECDDKFVHLPAAVRELHVALWCETQVAPLLARCVRTWPSYFGQDFGRDGDLSVVWPLQVRDDLCRVTPFLVEMRNVPHEQQKQVVFYIADRLPRFSGAKMDARGNGNYVAEATMQRYGGGKAEGDGLIHMVMLALNDYREMMPPFKAAFEDAMLEVPRHADVLGDLRQIRLVNGVPKIPDDASREGHDGRQRHADAAIAGMLAYAASRADAVEYDYTPAPTSQPLRRARTRR
jgi:phage FluMu gp28-like protein